MIRYASEPEFGGASKRARRGVRGPKLSNAKSILLKASKKGHVSLKAMGTATRYALDAAGFDPEKPRDKDVRDEVHRLIQERTILLGKAVIPPTTIWEAGEKSKKITEANVCFARALELIRSSRGGKAEKMFLDAYTEHTGELLKLRNKLGV